MVLYSSWVVARCSSCNRLHCLFGSAKSVRRLSGLLRSFCIYRENSMLRMLNSLSSSPRRFCRTTLCGVLSTWCHTMSFCMIHWRTVVTVSFDGIRAFPDGPFFEHLFRLVIHFCRSEGPCFTPRLLFFLITYPGIEVTSRLFWLDSARNSHFFHSCNRLDTFPRNALQSGHCCLEEFPQSSKISVLLSRRSSPAILCWTCRSSASGSGPEWMMLYESMLTKKEEDIASVKPVAKARPRQKPTVNVDFSFYSCSWKDMDRHWNTTFTRP